MNIIYRNKAASYPQRHGYQLRGTIPMSIVVHSTNNRRATSFASEVEFLFSSPDVSAHYLISKDGIIYCFLDPKTYQAWHAGPALPDFVNARSIGIELHISLGEQPTAQQIAALTELVRDLMRQFSIPPARVDTHRAIATPAGRKRDPEGWSDVAFGAWRAALDTSAPDPFDAWGPIGKPEGDARGWAVARTWLRTPQLGRCLAAEEYRQGTDVSMAVFERGVVVYKGGAIDRAFVVLF